MKISLRFQMASVVLGLAIGVCLANVHWAQADPAQEKALSVTRKAKENAQWIGQVLAQMQTLKPGLKRADLNQLFTSEGGIRGGLTYVYRECPLIKVDFEFKRAAGTKYDKAGRVTSGLSPDDEIISISKPYLQYTIFD